MRIAVLGPNWSPLVEPYAGGQESLVAALVAGLRAQGHAVELYAAAGTPAGLADRLFVYPALPELSTSSTEDFQLPEPRFLADHHAFTAAVADLAGRRDLDVVLNHSLHQLPLSLSKLLPAPLVTTLHTPPFCWMELGAALAGASARYVAVSSFLAGLWTTLSDVAVIPNGVDASTFPTGPGGDDLVWVGRIRQQKGLHVAVAAARHAGRRLHVVGPVGEPDYAAATLAAAGGDVVYHGHADHAEVARLVGRSAAILVTPLWEEPFGLVAAEAMMCGTPVVAVDRGGLTDVVGDDGGVLVAGRPDDTLARRLGEAVAAATRFDRSTVRAAALRRLSVAAMLGAYEDLVTEVVG